MKIHKDIALEARGFRWVVTVKIHDKIPLLPRKVSMEMINGPVSPDALEALKEVVSEYLGLENGTWMTP